MPSLPRLVKAFSPTARVLLGATLLYLPLVGLGYGADDDAYRLVRAGRGWVATGSYAASRNPGYPLVEGAVGWLDVLGGSLATNFGALAMALLAVGATAGVARRLGVPNPAWVAALVAVQPYVWANANTTMDHAWALGLLMAGWYALLGRQAVLAGVLLGCAVGARLSVAIAVAAVVAYAWYARGERREAFVAAGMAGAIGAAWVALPAWEAGWTLAFLRPAWLDDPAAWSPWMRVGRWAYKGATFWGLLPTVALAASGAVAWRERVRLRPFMPLLALAVGVVVAYAALYLRYPLDRAYLLPTVPFAALAVSCALAQWGRARAALLALVAVSALVTVELAQPDQPFVARSARVGVWVMAGAVAEQARVRWQTRGCETVACWEVQTGYRSVPIPE